jgi:hypothetical protein
MIIIQSPLKDQGVRISVGISCRFCEHGNEPTVSVKDGTFLRDLGEHHLPKNDSIQRFRIRNVHVTE